MQNQHCRIGRIVPKDPKLAALKPVQDAVRVIDCGWGQATFRLYDATGSMTNAEVVYMCEIVKDIIKHGRDGK